MPSSNKDVECVSGGGIGFGGALAILFIALKLCGVIDWSWWWVLSPVWIPLAFILLIVVIAAIVLGFASVFGRR